MRQHKIQLLDPPGVDGDGYPLMDWIPHGAPIWADVRDMSGRSYYAANAEQARRVITCNIAFRSDVDEGMRVRFRGDDYRITRIYSGDYRRIQLNIDCELTKGVAD